MSRLAVGVSYDKLETISGYTRSEYERIASIVAKQLQRGGMPTWVEFDDVQQAALLALLKKRPRSEALGFKMAHDAAIDEIRREDRHWEGVGWERVTVEDDDSDEPNPRVEAVEPDEVPVDYTPLGRAIGRLPVRQAKALRRRYFARMSHKEIAEELDCSVSASQSLVRNGLRELRAHPELLIFWRPSQRAKIATKHKFAPECLVSPASNGMCSRGENTGRDRAEA